METDEAVLIFDYWKDPLDQVERHNTFPTFLNEIDKKKHVYVLVSHHHKDHFNRKIFLWERILPQITFIISQDIFQSVNYLFRENGVYKGYKPSLSNVKVLKGGQIYKDSHLNVTAFESTDIGNSYAIEISGYTVFHAGDLNAWLWEEESEEDEIGKAKRDYKGIINHIASQYPYFDLVMFPVDSRQGGKYWWGAKYFVETIDTALFVPMHFELASDNNEKEQRRIDAAAFNLFARQDFGSYLQLASSRSRYITN